MQNREEKMKMNNPERGEIKVCNTNQSNTVNFRLKLGNRERLDALVEFFSVNDRSKALNIMIERWHDFKEDKIRAIHEIHAIMDKKGIKKEEL